ncbi:hypothetical protein AGLY_006259 [Aphis glycines]|uniref:Uncharacterized protein n=1 Tax=Aphis glycines TaxID=307491 RepID=A0A6G0TR13_APHGL|nr:hypothetical protein AGLY_006259 [Aphis glycines]
MPKNKLLTHKELSIKFSTKNILQAFIKKKRTFQIKYQFKQLVKFSNAHNIFFLIMTLRLFEGKLMENLAKIRSLIKNHIHKHMLSPSYMHSIFGTSELRLAIVLTTYWIIDLDYTIILSISVVINLFGSTATFDIEVKYTAPIRTFKINKLTLFNHFNLTLLNDKLVIIKSTTVVITLIFNEMSVLIFVA